jgi:hypothetical protein
VPPTVIVDGAHQNSPTGQGIDLSADVFDPGSGYGDTFSYQWSVTKDGQSWDPGTGETSPTLDFTPTDAGNYSVSLTATDADGGTGTASATTNVSDGLTISVSGATVAEGGVATFTVTLSQAPAATVTVCFATQSGVAPGSPYCAAGSGDFDDTSASWQVGPAGSLSYYVTVQTHLDSAMQGDEQFAAVVSGYDGNNNPIPGDTGYGTIERITTALTLHYPDGTAIPASQTASPGALYLIAGSDQDVAPLGVGLLTPAAGNINGSFTLAYDTSIMGVYTDQECSPGDEIDPGQQIAAAAVPPLWVEAQGPGTTMATLSYTAIVAGVAEAIPALATAAVTVDNLQLMCGSDDITNNSAVASHEPVKVGQQVTLSVVGAPAGATCTWAPPPFPLAVSSFDVSEDMTSGQARPVGYDSTSDSSRVVAFTGGGDGQGVAVEVSWYDPVRKRAFEEDLGGYFNVSAPSLTATATPYNGGTNGLVVSADGSAIMLGFSPPGQAGIAFSAAGTPGGWNYRWVQVITRDAQTETTAGLPYQSRFNGTGLDSTYPYQDGLTTRDSPGVNTGSGFTITSDFAAKMWLMCEPTGVPDATYVPLASLEWSYRFEAYCSVPPAGSAVPKVTFIGTPQRYPTIVTTLATETQFPQWGQIEPDAKDSANWTKVYS